MDDNNTGNSLYYPSEKFKKNSYIKSLKEYEDLCYKARENPDKYWSNLAKEYIDWKGLFSSVLNEDDAPFYKWFEGGKLNISYQCIDRHLEKSAQKVAIIWESESGEVRKITYKELSIQVNKCANMLKQFNISKGDRVVIYMPMIPEAIFAMLACARIGAIHVVVFGGFSAEVLKDRIIDTDAKFIITADGAFRHGKPYMLKPIVDEALSRLEIKPKVIVVQRNNQEIQLEKGREFIYSKVVDSQSEYFEAVPMNSEDTSFILHTSGSTGKPKGIKHSIAGYILWAQYTTKNVFDIKKDDIFWCTADIGWITGHTYTTYGPLALGTTTLIYEGVPNFPDYGRWWAIIEKHKVTQLYTAPTAIRLLHKEGESEPIKYDISSLRVLGSVGEPINPEAWKWYYEAVGRGECPLVDTWWQTETGGHVITPLPGATPLKPSSATKPLPGLEVDILDEDGQPVGVGEKGYLCITRPWPSMLRSVWNDDERFKNTYFSKFTDGLKRPIYFTGDGAVRDSNGYITVTGRVDDVINMAGHRVGTAEVESVISCHDSVAEVAVVSRPDSIRGEQIFAFIVLKNLANSDKTKIITECNKLLSEEIGSIIKLEDALIVDGLPKTRSGKLLRRLLRSVANGEEVTQDISTLDNPLIVREIQQKLLSKN